jgi:hypothetical protein
MHWCDFFAQPCGQLDCLHAARFGSQLPWTLGHFVNRSAFVALFEHSSREELGAKLREASNSSPKNAAEAFDYLGLEIAKRYHQGQLSFEDADWAVNDMWGAMCQGRFLTEFFDFERAAVRVFLAFDEGEYRHQSDSDEVDPVKKYTDPLIGSILKEFGYA